VSVGGHDVVVLAHRAFLYGGRPMFSRKTIRVVASVVLLAVVGVFSQLNHQSISRVKQGSALTAQTPDQRVLKADGTDPSPTPPQTLDQRVLKADGTDPSPTPPHSGKLWA